MFKQKYDVMPRHVLCVLGSGLDLGTIEEVVGEVGGPGFTVDRESFRQAPDPRMVRSFRSCLMDDTFERSDWKAVEEHDSVAYVLSPPMAVHSGFDPHRPTIAGDDDETFELVWYDAFDASRLMLAVTAALLRSGATAAKNESSGLTHGRDRWLAIADRAAGADDWVALAVALYYAWVKRPLADGNLLRSCGMHLLGAPDVEVEAAWLAQETGRRPPGAQVDDSVELMDQMALYLLCEDRARKIQDGEGFRLAPDAPRWILERHPCRQYDEDDFYFNPYGYWRLTPDASSTPAER
ncbi:hypothetical protein GCM10010517_61910 [Streptosporangium fragile]|uniref:DUF4261 domain-containing protein n=1 Tax=Streptosporangium fragile TaxID=46186 RepID=A0ABP6ILN5_9ACTN